jgi:hypothetical protein
MRKLLLAAGFLGPALFVGGFLILGAKRPGYSPRYTFASQLALNGGGRTWQTINCVAGLLIVAFGLGLHRTVREGVGSFWGWVSVVAGGLGMLIFGLSPDDPWLLYPPPDAPRGIWKPVSPSGRRHQLGALLAGGGLLGAHVIFGQRFAAEGSSRRRRYSLATAVLFPLLYGAGIFSGVASWVPGSPLGGNAGLLQKASMATSLVWVAWLAWHFLSITPADETA